MVDLVNHGVERRPGRRNRHAAFLPLGYLADIALAHADRHRHVIEIRHGNQGVLRLELVTLLHVNGADGSVELGFNRLPAGKAHQFVAFLYLFTLGDIDFPHLSFRGCGIGRAVDQLHAPGKGKGIGDVPGRRRIGVVGDSVFRLQPAIYGPDGHSDHQKDHQRPDQPFHGLPFPAFLFLPSFRFFSRGVDFFRFRGFLFQLVCHRSVILSLESLFDGAYDTKPT